MQDIPLGAKGSFTLLVGPQHLVVHPVSYAVLGRSAMPGRRRGRWRRRLPQTKG